MRLLAVKIPWAAKAIETTGKTWSATLAGTAAGVNDESRRGTMGAYQSS